MTVSRILVLGAFLCSVWGCHTTPYQKAYGGSEGGYLDQRLSEDTFYVQFSGSVSTPSAAAEKYLYRRAGEVTLRHGFRYFTVLRGPQVSVRYRTVYHTIQDRNARLDGMEATVPVWGQQHMTIQCFKTLPTASADSAPSVIDAVACVPPSHKIRYREARADDVWPYPERP